MSTDSTRLHGKIVKFLPHRAFGFIAPDGNTPDCFFHCDDVATGEPQYGARVSYTVGTDRAGRPIARDVQIEDDAADGEHSCAQECSSLRKTT